jgi:hypothetical protein
MRLRVRILVTPAALAAGVTSLALATTPPASTLPPSAMAVFHRGQWREWWRSDRAPEQWTESSGILEAAIAWRPLGDGAEWGEVRLAGSGEAKRLKLIVVRLDPRRVRLALDTAFTAGRERAAWTLADAPPDALVALNAGQFPRAMPWGWVVLHGREFLAPGHGPLSTGVAIDSSGGVRWIPGNALTDPSARRGAAFAFQSYPTLLATDGTVPPALRTGGRGIDVEHRDARLAIGQTRGGRLIIALTRFDAMGSALDFVPFGLTTPEMAAVMGALGARDAVMLDGGISSQLLIRDPTGEKRWTGLRKVPLALLVTPRQTAD